MDGRPTQRGAGGRHVNLLEQTVRWLTDSAHWAGPNGISIRLLEHLAMAGSALVLAMAIALPVGLWIGHTGKAATFAINLANLGRALPSLAVIGIVLPLTAAIDPQVGFKIVPTLIAMIVLGIPPILVNTHAGIAGVDRDLVEAARGMGFRERQILSAVELPVAVPVIAGGIRSAAVQIVATTTLGAIFGFGGLGRYLVDGIAQNDDGQIFGGVVLVAGLSLLTEAVFAVVQRRLTSPGLQLAGLERAVAERTGSAL
jgi:osmoprotectant transport system permease protein